LQKRASKLNCFLPHDTKGHEKKSCVRLPRIPDWCAVQFQYLCTNVLMQLWWNVRN